MFHTGGWWSYLQYDEEQDRPDIDRALLRRVWSYGRPYLGGLIGVLVTIVIISGLSVVPPILIRLLVDDALPNKDIQLLTLLGVGMILVPLINALIGVAQRWWSSRVGEGIIFDLRRELFNHLQRMSLRFFTATKTGELMNRLNSDVVGSQQAITGTLVTIVSNVVSVTFVLVVMLQAEWRLTLLAVAALPLFVLPARRVAKVLRRVTQQQMEHESKMSGILQEAFNVSGALLVRLFGRWDQEAERFGDQAVLVRDLGVRRAMVGRGFFAALGLVSAVGTAAVFWVGGLMVIRDDIKVGVLVMFAALLTQLYGPLSAISNSRVEFASSLVSFERVFEVLDLETDIPDPETPEPLLPVTGRVEFSNVWFRYQSDGPEGLEAVRRYGRRHGSPEELITAPQASTREWALRDVDFIAEPGTLTALVGPSGAGKTTISYLVPRLYDVTQGAVLIDGHDVRKVALRELSGSVGVVTQETYLFHDTIAANLRYAKPEAQLEELEVAARSANIHDMISKLPDGYDTIVGERGYRLSGGEKQRIAIARVLLEDPKVLILDEATSHLDSRSEALIQEALEKLMKGRTSVVIAHRLSTVRAADQILVIDDGEIVERGTHRSLVVANGLYAALYKTQFTEAASA
ncbi:MAG TPA: ABC transporter ATP-binding protein [Acidimicrobiia bacterium]|nr:ABC transporter ATP-binding protein [Acidimicrobiia bacterium]